MERTSGTDFITVEVDLDHLFRVGRARSSERKVNRPTWQYLRLAEVESSHSAIRGGSFVPVVSMYMSKFVSTPVFRMLDLSFQAVC